MRRIVVSVVVAAGLLGLAPVAAAGAGEPPLAAGSPGFTYTQLDERPQLRSDARTSAAPASGRSATGPAPAAAFAAPTNTDFVLAFAADVTAQQRAVFEAAAGLWSEVLEVEVPIDVDVDFTSFGDPGILGGAAPTGLFANDPSFPKVGLWYVAAQANQFAGFDIDPTVAEIDVLISSDMEFYEGVDGNVPADRISLLTLALHELGHGLGHTTLARSFPNGTATVRFEGLPMAFDGVIVDRRSLPITGLSPEELGPAVTDLLLWAGAGGTTTNGGARPKIYAPRLFEAGSSVSHLDEGTFTTGLMTPFIAEGEAQLAVPPITEAMFADFGWGVEAETRAEAFVTAASRDFVKRFPTPAEMANIAARLESGALSRHELVKAYALSDEWVGAIVDGFYLDTLDRPADPGGKRHWSDKLRSGVSSADVVSFFYASPEYYRLTGSTNRAWVRSLYVQILGREPDRGGWDSWTGAADQGTPLTTIARSFYQSPESRMTRVRGLYGSLLGRAPEPEGLAHWTEVLRSGRDIELAIVLASSPEYENRSFRRFG